MLKDYPQSLTNADILGQGNLDLVREKSGKYQGILTLQFVGTQFVSCMGLYRFLIFAPLLTFIIRVVLSVLRGGPKKSPRTFI